MITPAPAVRATAVANSPVGPQPVISTDCPVRSSTSAAWTALPSGSCRQAYSGGIFREGFQWKRSGSRTPGAAFVLTNARTRRSYLSPTIPIGAVLVELPALARLAAGGFDPRPLLPLLPERA